MKHNRAYSLRVSLDSKGRCPECLREEYVKLHPEEFLKACPTCKGKGFVSHE
jgi:Zn finger protein HypA/HybF involved in hydrogenase expression